eukprot:2372274-Amphidinium_carterae.1
MSCCAMRCHMKPASWMLAESGHKQRPCTTSCASIGRSMIMAAKVGKAQTDRLNSRQALANVKATADFDIKKEAAWAISNATSGGQPQQAPSLALPETKVEFLVECGCIKPLIDLMSVTDAKIIGVALEVSQSTWSS